MTVDELCQRVLAGRAELTKQGVPRAFVSTAGVILNPHDYVDVILEARRTQRLGIAVSYLVEGLPRILGFPMFPEPTLGRGEVRFRIEVSL